MLKFTRSKVILRQVLFPCYMYVDDRMRTPVCSSIFPCPIRNKSAPFLLQKNNMTYLFFFPILVLLFFASVCRCAHCYSP